jgi:diguanylate cyclase (GGDEF)-like protein
VDLFKDVNDRHGHATGDRVLKHVAQSLRGSLRGEDTVGRWGGEEFLILLPLQGLVSAKAALERCRVRIQGEPVAAEDGRPVRVTVSFGLAVLPGVRADTIQELIAAADAALYLAKRNGRNRVEVAPLVQRASA